jgi:hypothetical protein
LWMWHPVRPSTLPYPLIIVTNITSPLSCCAIDFQGTVHAGKCPLPSPFTNSLKVTIITKSNGSNIINKKQTPWLLARKRTIPTERPPLVGEI